MARRATEIGELMRTDREKAKRKIRAAFREAGGRVEDAAKLLDLARQHVGRLVRELDLGEEIWELRRKARAKQQKEKRPRPPRSLFR